MSADAPNPVQFATQDSGLECLNCGYNLTGLIENRCPECGTAFDPVELRRLCGPEPTWATPWDEPGRKDRFLATWTLASLKPRLLARTFPRQHNPIAATSYALCCYFLAACAFLFPTVLLGLTLDQPPRGFFQGCLGVALSAIVAAWVCEIAIASSLAALVPPTRVGKAFQFWRGLTRYAAGFLIPTGACGGLALFGFVAASESTNKELASWILGVPLLGAAAVFLWWCRALWRLVWCRGRLGSPRVLASFSIPLLGVGAILLGVFLAVLLFAFCAFGGVS